MLISEEIKSLAIVVLKLCLSEGILVSKYVSTVSQSVEKSAKYKILNITI